MKVVLDGQQGPVVSSMIRQQIVEPGPVHAVVERGQIPLDVGAVFRRPEELLQLRPVAAPQLRPPLEHQVVHLEVCGQAMAIAVRREALLDRRCEDVHHRLDDDAVLDTRDDGELAEAPLGLGQAQQPEWLRLVGLALASQPHQPPPQHVQVGLQPFLVESEEGRVEVDVVLRRIGLHFAPGQQEVVRRRDGRTLAVPFLLAVRSSLCAPGGFGRCGRRRVRCARIGFEKGRPQFVRGEFEPPRRSLQCEPGQPCFRGLAGSRPAVLTGLLRQPLWVEPQRVAQRLHCLRDGHFAYFREEVHHVAAEPASEAGEHPLARMDVERERGVIVMTGTGAAEVLFRPSHLHPATDLGGDVHASAQGPSSRVSSHGAPRSRRPPAACHPPP